MPSLLELWQKKQTEKKPNLLERWTGQWFAPKTEEVPAVEPTWWEKSWGELTKPREKIGGVRWEAYYRPDIARPFALGWTGEDIERISVTPKWKAIQQKVRSGTALTEDEIEFTDHYLEGHTTRPPGFTAEQWLAQPEAVQKGYNYLVLGMVVAGMTAPIWTHPSFGPMAKQAALQLYKGKQPERIPSRFGVVAATPKEATRIEPTFVKPSVKISAPTKIVETAIEQFKQSLPQVKIVKTETLRGRLENAIYKAIEQAVPGIEKLKVQDGIQASINKHLIGAPIEVSPQFAKATVDSVFNDFPVMLQQARAYGEILPALFEAVKRTPEEEIVDTEIGRKLTPTPEEYAPPEVAPKAEEITLEAKPPTKPPIPPTPPPKGMPEEPGRDPVVRLIELIKEAKPIRGKIETQYTKERAKRFADVDEFIDKNIDEVGGEEGFRIILSKMKGPLIPEEERKKLKISFEPVKDKLNEDELKALFMKTWKHPYLSTGEKLNAGMGLKDLFMGEIPQPKQLVLLEEIYGSEFIKAILKKRAWGPKAMEFVLEVANVPRVALSTADMSGVLRQNIIFMVAEPVISVKATAKAFQAAFKPEIAKQYFDDLRKAEDYNFMKKMNIAITDPTRATLVEREEAFISRFLQKVPIVNIPVGFAERGYTLLLTKTRVDVFRKWADELKSQGLDPAKDENVFQAAADVVNTFTGRGNLGKAGNRIAPQLNALFFSPRLVGSRFNALNPVWYARQPKPVRKKAIVAFAKFVAAGTATLALIKLAAGDDVEVGVDPRSADFGKIRVGNTRYDIWGGHQQFARVFTQIITGERKSTTTGEIISLNKDEYPFTTRYEVLLRFIEGKLAPTPALVKELMQGAKTFAGEDITLGSVAFEKFIPMYIQDIAEAYAEGGFERAIPAGAAAFMGVGVQTYGQRKKQLKKQIY